MLSMTQEPNITQHHDDKMPAHPSANSNNNNEGSNCNVTSTQESEDIQSLDWCVRGNERFSNLFQMKVITLRQLGNEENRKIRKW